jgi:hypothetical protein
MVPEELAHSAPRSQGGRESSGRVCSFSEKGPEFQEDMGAVSQKDLRQAKADGEDRHTSQTAH